jgi:hypothetical protein
MEVLKSVNALNTTEVHTVLKAQRNLMVLLKKPGLGGTDKGGPTTCANYTCPCKSVSSVSLDGNIWKNPAFLLIICRPFLVVVH